MVVQMVDTDVGEKIQLRIVNDENFKKKGPCHGYKQRWCNDYLVIFCVLCSFHHLEHFIKN